jgi:hypothetical protein
MPDRHLCSHNRRSSPAFDQVASRKIDVRRGTAELIASPKNRVSTTLWSRWKDQRPHFLSVTDGRDVNTLTIPLCMLACDFHSPKHSVFISRVFRIVGASGWRKEVEDLSDFSHVVSMVLGSAPFAIGARARRTDARRGSGQRCGRTTLRAA